MHDAQFCLLIDNNLSYADNILHAAVDLHATAKACSAVPSFDYDTTFAPCKHDICTLLQGAAGWSDLAQADPHSRSVLLVCLVVVFAC